MSGQIAMPVAVEPTGGTSTPHDEAGTDFVNGATSRTDSDTQDDDTDNGSDSDSSSQLSDRGELQEDLEEALGSGHFQFTGSFYHAALAPSSPNPCLFINGLGLVGLPLSNRDASSIVSVASLAPFGHGEQTLVDESVRHTWEIEPPKISFANEQWDAYINQTVCAEVCKSLGVSFGASEVPRMELYKLLLYEAGSHFLPHQDTQKADGMFATVIIVLPSAYAGGQVVLSHASAKKTIDFAPNSLLSTAVLAWYTDVTHEVKTVTSGYRLALSYNLIHTSAGLPLPKAPDMTDSAAGLRRVLRKWNNGIYSQDMIVYLLDHQYSIANLRSGINALKGADALRVHFLRKVAEEVGFRVGLAILDHAVYGSADDDGGCYYGRRGDRWGGRRWGGRRWGEYDEYNESDEGVPEMGEVDSTNTSISNMVDLNGNPLVTSRSIPVEEDSLIPQEPFEDESPDRKEYEGYMGNWAGQVEHHYKRTAIVILPEANTNDLCYRAEGLNYAFNKLKESITIPPTNEDRAWAKRVLSDPFKLTLPHVNTLVNYALKWKDLGIWSSAVKCPCANLQNLNKDSLLQAQKIFGFKSASLSFEELLARSRDLQHRLELINGVEAASTAEEKSTVDAWCKKETNKIMASYTTGSLNEVPTLLSIIKIVGLDPFLNSILPLLQAKPNIYDVWIALYKGLRQDREAIIANEVSRMNKPDSKPTVTTLVENLMEICIQNAVASWSVSPTNQTRLARIIALTECLLADGHMELCKAFFVSVLRLPGTASTNFPQLYVPLVSQLRALLDKINWEVTSRVVVDLYQVLIGTYLRDILGKRGFLANVNLRRIGCGCGICALLDSFIYSRTVETTFRVPQNQRQHLESRLRLGMDLCSFNTVQTGRPYGLYVRKASAVIQVTEWAAKQKAAKEFLSSIGPDAVIAKIMGARYSDVGLAINGTQQFGSANTVPSLLPPASAQPSHPGASSSANVVQAHQSVNTLKRKQPLKSIGPVIDLTLDSP